MHVSWKNFTIRGWDNSDFAGMTLADIAETQFEDAKTYAQTMARLTGEPYTAFVAGYPVDHRVYAGIEKTADIARCEFDGPVREWESEPEANAELDAAKEGARRLVQEFRMPYGVYLDINKEEVKYQVLAVDFAETVTNLAEPIFVAE
jgi:hypothetical protein